MLAPFPDPMPAALVARIDELKLLEKIAPATGERLLADRLVAEIAATEGLAPPDLPEAYNPVRARAYAKPAERVRMARICSLLTAGDCVVDIGVGSGYVMATMMQNTSVDRIVGVDFSRRLLDEAREVAEANGISDRIELFHRDVTKLWAGWLADQNADLVLMFEVLEHVADPAAALGRLAAELTDELLIFSVPIQGRIEACWGHRHAFDADAILRLCADAGLTVQFVEALHNTWAVFGVTSTPTPHPRLEQISPSLTSGSAGMHVTMEPVRSARFVEAGSEVDLGGALKLDLKLDGVADYVEFDTPNMALFRIEVAVEGDLREAWFEGIGASGEVICRWDVEDLPHLAVSRSYPFRPGWPNRIARPTVQGSLRRIHRMRFHVRADSPLDVSIPRAVNGQYLGEHLEPFVA